MPEYTLEELRKRSLSALHNAELTELAGDEQLSPNKVYDIAAKSHSERLAKAARFLAIVRRDYGTGAFEALVNNNTVEPAPYVEHVQENTMQKTQNATLSQIRDVETRIKLMLNLGLKTELNEEINSPLFPYQLYFEGQAGHMLFARGELLAYDGDETNPLHNFVLVLRDNETFNNVGFDSHSSHSAIRIHLPGFFKFMEWDEATAFVFVYNILMNTLASDPYKLHSSVDTAALSIAKHFADTGDVFFRQIQRWYLRSKFSSGRAFEMRSIYLKDLDVPVPLPKPEVPIEAELDTTVAFMRQLGMSIEDIQQDFLRVIIDHAKNCSPEFMLAFMGAECFGHYDEDREAVLLDGYLDMVWMEHVRSGDHGPVMDWLRLYCSFLKFLSPANRLDESRFSFYRDEFTNWISEGHIARVSKALVLLGGTLGTRDFTEDTILSLLPNAFTKAVEEGRCGAAVGLYDKYGDKCFGSRPKSSKSAKQQRNNLIADLRQYAKTLGQKTKLQ